MDNITLPGTGENVAADQQPDGTKVQRININDLSFLERIVLKALAKLTFTMTGLRVDTGGSSVAIASGTVTTVSNLNNGALGRNTPDGQGIQQSQQAFQSGFRRNLVIS